MTTEKLNLYQKLIEIRKGVDFLKKEAQGDGIRFKFTPSSQVLMAVKDLMNEHGVLIIPRVTGKEVSDHTTKNGNHWYFTELIMEFEWINSENPEDRFTVPWYGQGLDDGEKGVGKALTYAEKYLILKQFNIPTDKDDPDGIKPPSDKTSDKDALAMVKEMEKDLSSKKTVEATSKWWKDNAGKITTLPKKYQDKMTASYTTYKKDNFIKCPKDDSVKNRTECGVCENREGCPAHE